MGRNFDDYTGFHPFRSWANTYAQDCKSVIQYMESIASFEEILQYMYIVQGSPTFAIFLPINA